MMKGRDVLSVPTGDKQLIFASDCSGGIGLKPDDPVQADPEAVGYYCFRVAAMECLSAGADLLAVQLMNLTSDSVWDAYTNGINKGLAELGLHGIPVTGSSESNIHLLQSAIAVTCIGMKEAQPDRIDPDSLSYGVIGKPLVGQEVLENEESVAPLSLFHTCMKHPSIQHILPVGSKGIRAELSILIGRSVEKHDIHSVLDMEKSSGPSTSFILSYNQEDVEEVTEITRPYFHFLQLNSDNN